MAATAAVCVCSCSSRREEVRSAVVLSRAAELAAQYDLADVRVFCPDIAVDLRYATKHNIAGRALYPPEMPCLLKTSTAVKLAAAQRVLRTRGLSLRIWDAWRPPEVQLLLVEAEGNTGLFMDPKSAWSRHCSGTAVDVTLVDERGNEQKMPTYHDEGGPQANYNYQGGSDKVKRNLHTLQRAMVDAGFHILDTEWWHFDDGEFCMNPAPVIFGHQVGIYVPSNNEN